MSQKSPISSKKKCTKCGEEKDLNLFYQHVSGKRKGKVQSECKECCNRRRSQFRKNNPGVWADIERRARYRYKYGINPIDKIGECSICGKTKRLCVDHDHNTGKIRGIICLNCNVFIGRLENREMMKRYEEYLNKSRAPNQ